MVQMKEILAETKDIEAELYIPHGSDESL